VKGAISPGSIPRCVLITGATGGIGSSLALEYARAGSQTLILHGRNPELLTALADACAALGARVVTQALDMREIESLREWLLEISLSEAPDLVIANAGVNINTGTDHAGEAWDETQTLLDINIRALWATVHGVLPVI